MGLKGLVWSASAMGVLLNEGIGDTIRVSLTPRPNGDRREEVYAACELLQALGLRSFSPSVTACPGLRTDDQHHVPATRGADSELYPRDDADVEESLQGVETMTLAVMGCVVNGPGESKAANIGISLPGTGESPNCPIFIDGEHVTTCAVPTTSLRPNSSAWSMNTSNEHIEKSEALLRQTLHSVWGFSDFRPLQREAMQAILSARDSVVVLPTGGGKSLCFQAPALIDPASGVSLVVSPLISLMKDQVDGLACRRRGRCLSQQHAAAASARRRHRQRSRWTVPDLYVSPERIVGDARYGGCWSSVAFGLSRSTKRTASVSGGTISGPSTGSSARSAASSAGCRGMRSPPPRRNEYGATSSTSSTSRMRYSSSDRSIGRTLPTVCCVEPTFIVS
jgi:hypothetical protein